MAMAPPGHLCTAISGLARGQEQIASQSPAVKVAMRILLLVVTLAFSGALELVHLGVFLDEQQPLEALKWDVVRQRLPLQVDLPDPEVLRVPPGDGLAMSKIFCRAAAPHGFSAVLGPRTDAETLESLCAALKVPFIQTRWSPMRPPAAPTSFNLFPDANLLSQGVASVVRSLDWERFVVLFEGLHGLAALQDVLKLQRIRPDSKKNSVLIRRLGSGPDYRELLKAVAALNVRRIVLHCHVDLVGPILLQGMEVGLFSDFSTSVLLTDLDAHTVDFKVLDIEANVTALRLFDPGSPQVRRLVHEHYPGVAPERLRVEAALQHDALLLLAAALQEEGVEAQPRNCSSPAAAVSGLVAALEQAVLDEGLTGSEVRLEGGRREDFELQVVEVRSPDKPIGLWSSRRPQVVHLTRNATEIEREFRERMRLHNFIVSSKLGKPYLMPSGIEGATGNARFKGFSMDLIQEVAKLMNVQFQFVLAHRNLTSSIVADLMNRRADLGICDFTITQQRSEMIDFSLPIMSLGISILHKETEQEEIDNMYGFMRPFSIKVWVYIITLYLGLSIAILLIARLDPDDWENPHPCNPRPPDLENIWDFKNCLWLTLGSLMTQGCDILPKGVCSRLATAMWWFFSLIMTSTYTANLAAFLTMSRKDDAIKSVHDLANQNKIKYGVMSNGSTQAFFETSTNSLFQKMWATMKNENPKVFEDTNDRGVERVLSTKKGLYAFFMESPQIEYELARHCGLKKIDQYLDSKSYGIGMPLGADYRRSINSAVLQLQENGKLLELKAKWWKQEDLEAPQCDQGRPEGNKDELGLANVGGVFVVLVAGIALALLFAIGEFLWNVHSIAVREHTTFLQALRCELKFACNIKVTRKPAIPEPEVGPTMLAEALDINASLLNRLRH